MGLTRDVMIDGTVYGYHELSMLECVPNDHITVTVENFTSEQDKQNGEMPRDTYHELPWPKDGVIRVEDAEESVFGLEAFAECVDTASELEAAREALREREATIEAMEGILTSKQRTALASKLGTVSKGATAKEEA